MLEAVGEAYWPVYFKQVHDRLRPGGVAVIQVISIAADRYEGYRRRPDFIQRYIFPGGMLPTPAIVADQARAAGLDDTLDAAEVAAAYEGMLPLDDMLRQSGQYGPRVDVPADAPLQDKLMAFVGRQP